MRTERLTVTVCECQVADTLDSPADDDNDDDEEEEDDDNGNDLII